MSAISTIDFLKLFVPADADGFLELRARNQPGPRDFIQLSKPDADLRVLLYIAECAKDGNHPFFGVAERATTLNGTKANLSWWRVMFADCDFKGSSEAWIRCAVDAFPLSPSILVESGGGLYPFWVLTHPIDLRVEGAIARVEALTRRIVATLNADDNATPVSQLLRLPGTTNLKPAYGPEGRPCRIAEFHPERTYTIEQFEALAELLPDPKAVTTAFTPRPESRSIGVVNPEKVVSVLGRLWPDSKSQKRHAFAKHLGGWFANHAVDEEDAVEIVRTAAGDARDDDVKDRVKAIRDSYTYKANGHNPTGLPSALEIVPELKEVVDVLNEALGIVPSPSITVTENEEPVAPPTSHQLALPAAGRIGLAKDWADLYASEYEAPWENWYFAILTHIGARVAKHLRLDDDLDTEALLYSILLGLTGAGKSLPIRKAEADCAWADLGRDPHFTNPEAGLFRVIHGVGSGEAIGEALQEAHNRQAILQPDEFSHITNKAKIDGGSLIQILLSQFDRGVWDNRTKGAKGYELKGSSLSLLSACVDEVFPTLFDPKGGADTGIIPRFWIVTGPASTEPKPVPRIDRGQLDAIRGRLRKTLEPFAHLGMESRVMVVPTPEASALFQAWYREEYFPLKDKDAAMLRLNSYANRFIMLGALMVYDGVICPGVPIPAGVEVMEAALTMVRWQYRVRMRYTPIIAETRKAKVEMTITRAFRDAGEQGMTKREAQRQTSASKLEIEGWNRAFDVLCQNGNLVPLEVPEPTGRRGRPQSVRFKLAFM